MSAEEIGILIVLAVVAWLADIFARPRKPLSPSDVGTERDPRVEAMVTRQKAYGKRLRRQGRTLLAGKEYIPTMTMPQAPKPPLDDKVIRLRRRQV